MSDTTQRRVVLPSAMATRRSLLTLLVFLAYAATVFWVSLTSLEQQRQDARARFQRETEMQASAVAHFFSDLRNDLGELAEAEPVVRHFIANRPEESPGPERQGEVRAIQNHLERLIQRRRVNDHAVYSRIALIDREGTPVAGWNMPTPPESLHNWLAPRSTPARVDLGERPDELVVSAPIRAGDTYLGEAIAWIDTRLNLAQAGQTPLAGDSLLLITRTGSPLLSGGQDSALALGKKHAFRSLLAQASPPAVAVVERVALDEEDRLVAKVDIGQTPLSYVSISTEQADAWSTASLFVIGAAVVPLIVILLALLDALERRRLEQERELSRREAKRLARVRGEFVANMSHEIRTPLNAIVGMAELSLGTVLNPKQRNYLGKIKRASDSLLHVVNDILDFSKIESGKLALEMRPFEIDALIDAIGAIFSERSHDKSIDLVFDVDESLDCVFLGDQLRLEQVLINLVANALKFSEHGDIVVRVRSKRANVADQHAQADHAGRLAPPCGEPVHLHFSVIDRGPGLSAEQQAQLFTAFTQADAETTRHHGGTGLGLAICKRLVELMSGSISVSSEPGKGSRFEFFVRVETDPAQESNIRAMRLRLAALAERRVLVIDDDPIQRAAISAQLRQIGLTSDECLSLENALAVGAQRRTPEYLAIVANIHARGAESAPALWQFKRNWHNRMPPVILVSTQLPERELLALSNSSDGMIPLPTSASRLFGALAPLLGIGDGVRANTSGALRSDYGNLRGKDVLLVDDVDLNREVVCDMLKSVGVHVRIAADGVEALEAIGLKTPDAVLMDCQMPRMDGYEATRRLRRQDNLKNLPVIALTANALPSERGRCLAAGMKDYIAKPVASDTLYAVLSRHLPPPPVAEAPSETASLPVPGSVATTDTLNFPGIDGQLGLRYANEKPSIYFKILTLFRDVHGRDFEAAFRRALTEGKWTEAARLAHTLKSSAKTIGAMKLSELADRLEAAAHAHADGDVETCQAALLVELDDVCAGLADVKSD